MIETLKNAWKVPDLRRRLLFTVMILIIFRFGSVIPVPFIDTAALAAKMTNDSGTIFGVFDILSGGGLSKASIFAMSISPYINASIIIQLLTVAIPALERLAKEGMEGRKKIGQITRYTTVLIGLIQGFGFYGIIRSWGAIKTVNAFTAIVIVLTFTAGTAFIMWLGEQITDKGVGNGISIILFSGIVAGIPSGVGNLIVNSDFLVLAAVAVLALIAVAFVVFMNESERRIPVQYAKRVVGRKMYGGQSSHIPLKVNMAGVMPIIFASSISTLPATVAMFFPGALEGEGFWSNFLRTLQPSTIWYGIMYFVLIIFFNYFYIAIQYNPIEMSNNMKKNGGFVPGIRPGKPTADFITRTLSKITLMGAMFLGVIAVMPIILSAGLTIQNFYFGGTSLLIVVGVALETVKQIESLMLMRNYKGFLE